MKLYEYQFITMVKLNCSMFTNGTCKKTGEACNQSTCYFLNNATILNNLQIWSMRKKFR